MCCCKSPGLWYEDSPQKGQLSGACSELVRLGLALELVLALAPLPAANEAEAGAGALRAAAAAAAVLGWAGLGWEGATGHAWSSTRR